MSAVTYYGHQIIAGMTLLAKPDYSKTSFDPLTPEGGDPANPDEWIGYQHLYQTSQEPPTRLQVVFLSDDYPALTLDNKLLEDKPIEAADVVAERVLPVFQEHPDPVVALYVENLLGFYGEEEGVEIRVIPWEEELYGLQQDNEFAGIEGLFFPIIHFYLTDPDWSVIVRCEPVLGIEKEKV